MCSVCAQLILGKVRGKMGRKKDENVLRIILFQKILEKSRAKVENFRGVVADGFLE